MYKHGRDEEFDFSMNYFQENWAAGATINDSIFGCDAKIMTEVPYYFAEFFLQDGIREEVMN